MTIPATLSEVEQIYLQTEMAGHKTICITSCQSQDGVTSLASALTERLILAGYKTLYVDLNSFTSPFENLDQLPNNAEPNLLIQHKDNHQVFNGITLPARQLQQQLHYKDPIAFFNLVQQWQQTYQRIVFDTSPLLHLNKDNIPAQVIATASDATILVISYATCSEQQIKQAKLLLSQEKINFIGTVFNMRNHQPLAYHLSQKILNSRWLPKYLKTQIAQSLKHNELLNLPY